MKRLIRFQIVVVGRNPVLSLVVEFTGKIYRFAEDCKGGWIELFRGTRLISKVLMQGNGRARPQVERF